MKIIPRLALLGTCALSIAASPASTTDLPAFQPGLWSFSSTVSLYGTDKPKVRTMTRCADPTAETRRKWDSLAQSCKFSPLQHTGKTYSYSSTCNQQGRVISMKSVITADSAEAYRVDTQSHTTTQASREIVIAKRLKDCPK